MKRSRDRRPVSVGTVFMLAMLAVVLAGSVLVLGRLSSGGSVDLSKLNMKALDLGGRQEKEVKAGNDTGTSRTSKEQTPSFPENPGSKTSSPDSGRTEQAQTAVKADAESVQDATAGVSAGIPGAEKEPAGEQAKKKTSAAKKESETEETKESGSYRLTVAGSIAVEGEILKNAWNADSGTYDFSDIMMLLKPELEGRMNAVFLENTLSENGKANDTTTPAYFADLLQEAEFNIAACGFSGAYDRGPEGIESTWMTLDERGILPIGIRTGDNQNIHEIKTVNGVKTAFLQYTGTVPLKTRKKMVKADNTQMIPEAEESLIADEIHAVREQGAEAVIVFLKWGKTGNKPDESQRELAVQIAEAGADMIIGSGSRIPQGAEYLEGKNGEKILCAWSLGSLLTGDRNNAKHMAGYLLHVTVRKNGQGGVDILAPEYSPVYTWKYKQDGRYYYRCLASDQTAPDGMDAEQQKIMTKAFQTVRETLENSPLTLRNR